MIKTAKSFQVAMLAMAISLLFSADAHATKLFGVNVTSGSTSISESSSSILGVIEAAVKREGEFASLIGSNFTASVTYFGVGDAFYLDVSADGKQVVIGSRLDPNIKIIATGTDQDQTFEDLKKQLKQNVSDFWSSIQRKVAQETAATISDGSPASTTAMMSTTAYSLFGTPIIPSIREQREGEQALRPEDDFWWITMGGDIEYQNYRVQTPVGTVEGNGALLRVPFGVHFADRVSILGMLEGNYTDYSGTKIYGGSFTLGPRVHIFNLRQDSDWLWYVTPYASIGGRYTSDGLSGSLLAQGGINNVLGYRINEHLILSWTLQYDYFSSIEVKLNDVVYDAGITQEVVRTTGRASIPFAENWVGNLELGGATFLRNAAIDQWLIYGASVNYHLADMSIIEGYFRGDVANNYQQFNVGLQARIFF